MAALVFSFGKILFSNCGQIALSPDCCYIHCGVNPVTHGSCCVPRSLRANLVALGITPPCCVVGSSFRIIYGSNPAVPNYWYGEANSSCPCATSGGKLHMQMRCNDGPPSFLEFTVWGDTANNLYFPLVITTCDACPLHFVAHADVLGSGAANNCCGSGTAYTANFTGPG